MADNRGPASDLAPLRKMTVTVILFLVLFVVIGNYVDDVFLGNHYQPDGELFPLVVAIIAGEFSAEAIVAIRGRK